MIRIVPIKFRAAGRHYDFNALHFELTAGDRVVVETDRGRALGTVVESPREIPPSEAPEDIKSIVRPATDEDIALADVNTTREKEALRFCQQRIKERRMEMKLVRAEYLFDGSKIIFYFTADGRVDFRELVKDLAHHFHTRIEMRQIGVRDEAKMIGGIGICGRELCCCTFLTEFAPVSVKMAKEQGLALNPNKISGQCGRLLCCLGYEFETYCGLRKNLPKCGRRVSIEGKEGEVVDQKILAQKVTLRMEDGKYLEVTAEQVERGQTTSPAPSTPSGTAAPPARAERGRETQRPREPRPRREEKPRAAQPAPQPAVQPAAPPAVQPTAPVAPETAGDETAQVKSKRKRNRGRRRPRQK
jgi:cell fate regulator YaaT (PSP1 superfamily)